MPQLTPEPKIKISFDIGYSDSVTVFDYFMTKTEKAKKKLAKLNEKENERLKINKRIDSNLH